MLLHDDVMADREAETGTLASRLCRKERIEQLFPDLGRNAGAVVTYRDLHMITKVAGCGRKGRLVITVVPMRFAFGRRIKPVWDQIE